MDPLTMALLALKAGAGFIEKTGQPTEFAQVAPPAQQGAQEEQGGMGPLLKQMLQRLFGAQPTNISPPVMQNMVGPFKPTMPKDDPYGYGNYY